MDFLNIGPFEVILILILAFLFFGPEKLPSMAAKAGKVYRDLRKATFDLSKTINEEISTETRAEKETKNLSAPEPSEKTSPDGSQPATSLPKSDEKPHE
jgi:TatA/E family protein of Tat protein translocase